MIAFAEAVKNGKHPAVVYMDLHKKLQLDLIDINKYIGDDMKEIYKDT